MRIISKSSLNRFIQGNPGAAEPMLRWYLLAKQADWADMQQLKAVIPGVDYVGNGLFVFNIGGNKFRLIARIIFRARTIYIRWMGPHSEYDKVKLSDL